MNYTRKNIPDEISEKIKIRAARNRRSINSEIIEILAALTVPPRPTVEEILVVARELRSHTRRPAYRQAILWAGRRSS